jgi:hypothetical protein
MTRFGGIVRPTQKTCSTAGPLCIISPNAISWAEVPLSLPVPITQHTPGPAFVQWLVIHTEAVGERKRAKGKEEASGVMSGAFLLGGIVRRGASDRKNPLPVTTFRRGHNTCAVWTPSHTARLGAGRRLHRSAPLCKGYCYTDRPTRKPWGFTPTTNLQLCLAGALLSRGAT